MGIVDERQADVLLVPVLSGDPRLKRTVQGWVSTGTGGGSAEERSLSEAAAGLFAPRRAPVAAVFNGGAPGEEAVLAVAFGGEGEGRRVEERLGRTVPRPIVDLSQVVRRLFGWKGDPDPLKVASFLGLRFVEEEAPEGRARVVLEIWEQIAADLLQEGVRDWEDLDRLLQARLEQTDFAGKKFGPTELVGLPIGPGVYRFSDSQGKTLYVGQSSCLAARVASYFRGVPRDEKDRVLRQKAVDLTTRTTDSVPDALILEAKWIRRFRPLINVKRTTNPVDMETGLLAAPIVGSGGRWVLFALGPYGLQKRMVLGPGGKAQTAALNRAAGFLFSEQEGPGDRQAGALLMGWRRSQRFSVFLQPGVDGGPKQFAARLADLVGKGAP